MQGCTRRAAIGAGLAALLSGCGWFGGDADDAAVELPVPTVEPVPTAHVEKLELKLNVGDRFPLIKTVTQELNQASVIGPALSRTRLELLLTLTVEETLPDRKRLGVRYNRVKYSQDVAGEKFDFDSNVVQGKVPKAAFPYSGLVGNGFSFWIGRDNQIIEPVGFGEFLERCVRDVPQEERLDVLRKFARTTTDEGIANFVDDSIGLLPYDVEGKHGVNSVAEGDTWTRERRLLQPMPLSLRNRYTLKSLSTQIAEIDILGTVSPATTSEEIDSKDGVVPAGGVSEVKTKPSSTPDVVVRGGNAYGTCTIDRGTGLPLKSHVERYLDMHVRLPNGFVFEQRKRTVTTIQAFPQQRQAAAASGESPIAVKPVELRTPPAPGRTVR